MIDWDSLRTAEARRKEHQRAILAAAGLDYDEEMRRIDENLRQPRLLPHQIEEWLNGGGEVAAS